MVIWIHSKENIQGQSFFLETQGTGCVFSRILFAYDLSKQSKLLPYLRSNLRKVKIKEFFLDKIFRSWSSYIIFEENKNIYFYKLV